MAEPQHQRLVLVATLTGQFATSFPVTLFSVVLAPIARSYGVTASVLTWAITGPFLVMAVATPVFGKLGDTYGHRRLFLIGLAGSAAAALATAAAPTAATLIALRIVGQTFGAASQPTALALIMRAYPVTERAKATGWWAMVGAGSPVTGLVIGGPLAEAFGWRSLFYIQAGITVVSLLLAVATLPRDEPSERTRVDFLGACLLMGGVLAVLYAINELPSAGLTARLGAVFAAGLVVLGLFTWRQSRISYPLIRTSFFRSPAFCLAIAIPSCLIFGYFGGFLLTPLYLETALGTSLWVTSLIMTLRPVSNSLASPMWVRLPRRWTQRGPLAGSLLSVLAMVVFALGAAEHSVAALMAALVLGGLGLGVSQPGLTVMLINSVRAEDYGSAAGLQVMFTQIFSVLGLSVLGGVAAGRSTAGHAPYYVAAYLIGGVVAVIGVVLAVYLRIRVPDSSPPPPGFVPAGLQPSPAAGADPAAAAPPDL
jgi:MFS family permease